MSPLMIGMYPSAVSLPWKSMGGQKQVRAHAEFLQKELLRDTPATIGFPSPVVDEVDHLERTFMFAQSAAEAHQTINQGLRDTYDTLAAALPQNALPQLRGLVDLMESRERLRANAEVWPSGVRSAAQVVIPTKKGTRLRLHA